MPETTKPCPFCAEAIAVTAKKCRFCNEWLDGSGGNPELALRWEGPNLLVPFKSNDAALDMVVGIGSTYQTAPLPAHACWICGGADRMTFKRKSFLYTPPWIFFGLILGP